MASARLPRATREAQMLDVATEVFCERGYAGASMNDIAARCGVTKPMLYLYFSSKEGLYRSCLRFVGEGLIDAIERAVADAQTPMERILATASGLFGYAEQRDRTWWGVIYAETMPADSEVAAAMRGYRARIFAIVHAAVAELIDDRVDAEIATHALIGAGESILRWWVEQPQFPAAQLTSRLAGIITPILTRDT